MTSALFAEWQEYYAREPWGFQIADVRHSVLAATVARSAGADVEPKDFSMEQPEEERKTENVVNEMQRLLTG